MNRIRVEGFANNAGSHGTERIPVETIVHMVGPINESGELTYLPRKIRIERDGSNRPLFSLCLVLARTPRPDEDDIANLIDRGVLNLTATLRVPDDQLTSAFSGATPRPAFTRTARFFLTNTDGSTIVETLTSGPGARGSLSANLDAAMSRSVMSALAGGKSGLDLKAEVISNITQSVAADVHAAWVDIYDALFSIIGNEPTFGLDRIEEAFNAMLRLNKLRVTVEGHEQLSDEVTTSFLLSAARRSGGVVLARVDSSAGSLYRLRERPDPSFQWHFRETIAIPKVSEYSLATSFEESLEMVLHTEDWSRYVTVIAPERSSSGILSHLPRRSRGVIERGEREEREGAIQSMALVDSNMLSIESVTMTNRPRLRPKPVASGLQQLLLPDTKFSVLGQERIQSLPVVDRFSDAVFRDRVNSRQLWYVPKLEFVEPLPADSADCSPFEFAFERKGITQDGEPVLSGWVRFTLRQKQTEATQLSLADTSEAQAIAVPILDLSFQLSIPYIDSDDNTVKRFLLRGSHESQNGNIVVIIPLANRWLRLVYGVLSTADFQGGERARIEYSFRYRCYRKLKSKNIDSVFGTKDASLPILRNTASSSNLASSIIGSTGILQSGGINLRFGEDEANVALKVNVAPSVVSMGESFAIARPITLDRPLGSTVIRPLPIEIKLPIANRPPILPETLYAEQSVGVQGEVSVLMPCSVFGGFYRQQFSEGWRSIGCQNALKLGQTSTRLYEEIPELAGPWMRVFRTLPQPGRFLVVPRTLRISRYPLGHPREFLPAAMVYAVLDSDNPSASRYIIVATLEPDIPPFAILNLRQRLGKFAPQNAIYLDFPTEIADTIELPAMPLNSRLFPPRFTINPPGIQVSLECLLPDALVLRKAVESLGILGQLTFTFRDGTKLTSNLELNLSQITGPFNQGPISVTHLQGQVRLTNRINSPIDVVEVRYFVSGTPIRNAIVGQRLEGGQSLDLDCEESAEAVPIYSIPQTQSTSLEESRIYIEDVSINVIFTCGVNFVARSLADVIVYARLKNGTAEQRVVLQAGMPRVGEAKFIVTLSSFIAETAAMVEYRVVRLMLNGEKIEKPWTDCRGAVVDLQWETIS